MTPVDRKREFDFRGMKMKTPPAVTTVMAIEPVADDG